MKTIYLAGGCFWETQKFLDPESEGAVDKLAAWFEKELAAEDQTMRRRATKR